MTIRSLRECRALQEIPAGKIPTRGAPACQGRRAVLGPHCLVWRCLQTPKRSVIIAEHHPASLSRVNQRCVPVPGCAGSEGELPGSTRTLRGRQEEALACPLWVAKLSSGCGCSPGFSPVPMPCRSGRAAGRADQRRERSGRCLWDNRQPLIPAQCPREPRLGCASTGPQLLLTAHPGDIPAPCGASCPAPALERPRAPFPAPAGHPEVPIAQRNHRPVCARV